MSLGIGAIVPADLRILTARGLECDESILTGESLPVDKSPEPAASASPKEGPSPALFMGTVVHRGSAQAVVVATGADDAVRRDRARPRGAPAADGVPGRPDEVLRAPRQGRRRPEPGDLRDQRRPGPAADRRGAVLARDRGGDHAAAAAGGRVDEPRDRRAPVGRTQGPREAAGEHRGPRRHRRPVLRQDGHAHRGADHLRTSDRHERRRPRSCDQARAALHRCDGVRRGRRRRPAGRSARAHAGTALPTGTFRVLDHHPVRPRAAQDDRPRGGRRRPFADHEGRSRVGARPLRRRDRRDPGLAAGTVRTR